MNYIPKIVSGTQDFYGINIEKRNYLTETITKVLKSYGYNQLDTPAFEYLDTVSMIYGDESDKLIYRILNSGNFLDGVEIDGDYRKLSSSICKKGLRYDLTLPLMRYVLSHKNELVFPFRRYQVQPVWRADRPQKGRYREFYQYDADIIGSSSLSCELELLSTICEVLRRFGITGYTIRINHRDILLCIISALGYRDLFQNVCTLIDKTDKIGVAQVINEIGNLGITDVALSVLSKLLGNSGRNVDILKDIDDTLSQFKCTSDGIKDLRFLLDQIECYGIDPGKIKVDFSLIRGLSYYTGTVFEVVVNGVNIGSIIGGGRYKCLKHDEIDGVGLSFGLDRISVVLDELNLWNIKQCCSDVLFAVKITSDLYNIVAALRGKGLKVELYLDGHDTRKQLEYANKKNIKYVVFDRDKNYIIKEMESGEQQTVFKDNIFEYFNDVC